MSNIATNTGMDAMMEDVKKRGFQEEVDRLSDNHLVYTDAADGKLSFVPLDWKKPGLRILDSATADGLWLRELRKEAGSAAADQTYVGTDLVEDFFPLPSPEGMEFHRQSITEPWPESWNQAFDLVHQRQVLGFCGKFSLPQAVANLAKLAKPGGWVELIELEIHQELLDEGTVMSEFAQLLVQMWRIKGMGGNFGLNLKGWMEDAGLEDVQQSVLNCKVGAMAKPELKLSSINGAAGAGPMILAMARETPELKGFTPEQLDTMMDRLQVELLEKGMVFYSFSVMGRVPADGLKPKPLVS